MHATSRRIAILAACLLACLVMPGCYGSEAGAAMWRIFSNLAYFGLLVFVSTAICFALNKYVSDKEGRTLERWCSVAGMIIFPPLFLAFASFKWGFNWPTIGVSLVLGGVVGWFSYTLDELMEHFWDKRRVTLPATIGLTVGLTFVASIFSRVWLRGDMYVTHHASATRVVIHRWFETEDDEGNKSCHRAYHDHADKVVYGSRPPEMIEDVDYELGYGARGYSDDVVQRKHFHWIGGHLYSEADGQWEPFRWLRLAREDINFNLESVQRVGSDYYGHPIVNEGKVRPPKLPLPEYEREPPLPDDLPPGHPVAKLFSPAWQAVRMMFVEREYRLLLVIVVTTYSSLGIAAIFLPKARAPVGIFVICSTIIILLVMMILAAWLRR